jgi:hypothetical protein
MPFTKTTEQFIADAKAVHGEVYDYSNTLYVNYGDRLAVVCKIHGEFWQRPNDHLQGCGCPHCGYEKKVARISTLQKPKTTEQFILQAQAVHGSHYDYSKVVYELALNKVKIICPTHGEFMQRPSDHLAGAGCKKCATAALATLRAHTTETFITQALSVHGNSYDYSNTLYVSKRARVEIGCKVEGHGTFHQFPGNHLVGSGCPLCGRYGFQKGKPGILYYLRVNISNGETLHKIGITNRSVEARFSVEDLKKIEVLWTKPYKDGMECYNEEQRILMEFKHLQYVGEPVLASGNTELFTEDVLCNYI